MIISAASIVGAFLAGCTVGLMVGAVTGIYFGEAIGRHVANKGEEVQK